MTKCCIIDILIQFPNLAEKINGGSLTKETTKMEKKLHKDVVRIGSENVDIHDLKHYEAVAIAVVGILSITIGTIYGAIMINA